MNDDKVVDIFNGTSKNESANDPGKHDAESFPEYVANKIVDTQFHHFEGTTCTVCCITMDNGFTFVGQSACVNPEDFDSELGEEYALQVALSHALDAEAYLQKERMSHE